MDVSNSEFLSTEMQLRVENASLREQLIKIENQLDEALADVSDLECDIEDLEKELHLTARAYNDLATKTEKFLDRIEGMINVV